MQIIFYGREYCTARGCNGTKWISLEGVRDVDNNTYIDAESGPETNENRLMFATDGNNRMVIDHSGNLGLGTTTPQSKLDVEGSVAIGSTYSGATAAPTNGLLVEGNVGFGAISPKSKLDVNGNVAIGSTYSGTTAAPTDGLFVEGN